MATSIFGTNIGGRLLNTVKIQSRRTTTSPTPVATSQPTTQSNTTPSVTLSDSLTVQGAPASGTQTSQTAAARTWTVGETAYMFMRAKTVTFIAQGLKPNTVYYPFFNGIDVSKFCSTQNGLQSSQIKTDAIGSVTGNFYLPSNTFVAGSHLFQLVDNRKQVGSSFIPDPLYGSAEAYYEANGLLKQQQTQVTVNTTTTVNVKTPVTVNLPPVQPIQPSEPTPPVVVLPPPVIRCESWFFEYEVFSSAQLNTFSVTTNSSTPPTNPSPSTGSDSRRGGTASAAVWISTTASGNNTFVHVFGTARSSPTTFRQEWSGPITDPNNPTASLPSLTSFRPSGLQTSDIVRIKKQWTRIGSVSCPVTPGLKTPTRVDPLAQSFFVDGNQFPNGIFVTSIGVYFKTVDQSTPVIMELRNMVNGLPGPDIFPGGVSIVPGYAAAQSDNATRSVVFRFDHPVYLRPSTDYCFVLKSTSMGYLAWSSRMGQADVTTGKIIDAQPYIGTMFKSENDSTWIPDSYEDIKFDLNIAVFDTSVTSNLKFYPQLNQSIDHYFGTSQKLPLSFISTTKGSGIVTVEIPMHSLKVGDVFYMEGIVSANSEVYNGIAHTLLNGNHTVTEVVDEDHVKFNSTGTATKTGNLLVSDVLSFFDNTPSPMPTQGTFVTAERFINRNTFAPSTVPSATINTVQPTPPTVITANSFTVYTNLMVNEMLIDYMGTEFDGTTIDETLAIADSTYAVSNVSIPSKGQFQEFTEPKYIVTPDNQLDPTSISILMTSASKDISPVIDVNGMSMVVKTYKIDNQGNEIDDLIADYQADPTEPNKAKFNDATYNSEIAPGTGNAAAKYKGPVNILKDFHNRITLFVTASCPSPAVIDAYIRTSADDSTHMDQNWVWVPINGVFGTSFTHSLSSNVTKEWMYVFESTEYFNVYDVKLVMRSTNSSVIPKIYGVRAITDITSSV